MEQQGTEAMGLRTASAARAVHIVDDDPQVRRALWFFLEAEGYSPRAFSSGADLLAELDQLPLAPMLLDLNMADTDGFQVLEEVKRRTPAAPVIVITGHGDVTRAVRAMKMGALDFVEKPFDDTALLGAVEAAMALLEEAIEQAWQAQDARQRVAALSAREQEVLCCLVGGKSNKVIAYDLGLSPRTVEMHRANMMQRLGVRTLPDALRIAHLAKVEARPSPASPSKLESHSQS
jgi:two-component system response regulator FixJ